MKYTMKKISQILATIFVLVVSVNLSFGQGKTTSTIVGNVVDENGEPLVGATVKAIHVPSGSVYGGITQLDGNYIIPNARVGGPYEIIATYVGYNDKKFNDVYLELGSRFSQDVAFDVAGTEIDAVTITVDGNQSAGVSNQVSTEQIETLPTLNRDLNDFTRTTPQANTKTGGISFAGLNNRYNAVYIDGAVNNDVFGLSDSGTNGGQIGISPISVDAIEQIQVVVSPYDVTLGGFAGGGVNAVTRSGTNELQGSAYYFVQNEGIAGKTNGERADRFNLERTKLNEFSEKTYGLRLGGPIIKDKLFFFVNGEIQDNTTPSNFDIAEYKGSITKTDITDLTNFLKTNYGYDPGTFYTRNATLKGTKFLGKFDYNLNENHKFTVRHSYTEGKSLNPYSSRSTNLVSSKSGQNFPSITNSSAIEWNFNKNKFANNLILGYTTVRDDRNVIGNPFPHVEIFDTNRSSLEFGSENYSGVNKLDQNVFTITDNFNYYLGDHTLTVGTHNEFFSVYNAFLPKPLGSYEFDSLADFYAGIASNYQRGYSLVDNVNFAGDATKAAADFNAGQIGFYLQDEYFVNNSLTLTGGLRFDIPFFSEDPAIKSDFNTTTLPAIQAAGWDTKGAEGGKAPKSSVLLSPRVGFNFAPENADNLTIKGGFGIFTSRIPFVWPGAMYSTNGVNSAYLWRGGTTQFEPDVNKQYTAADFGGSAPPSDVNLFAEDFKFPQVFRTSLGFEKAFNSGFEVFADAMYTKTLNNVEYRSVNFKNELKTVTNDAEARRMYTRSTIDDNYGNIYIGYNTNRGYSYNFSGGASKTFDNNLTTSVFYSYGDSYATNEGTSSQNSSQWRGQVHNSRGRNYPALGRSDFSAGHRVVGSAGYKFDWNADKNVATTVSLFYNGQSGTPFSWIVGGRNARNFNNEGGSTSRTRSLFYIPRSKQEVNFVEYTDDNGNFLSADAQWAMLENYIENDKYLRTHRGQYAAKNSNRTPFESLLDVKLIQDFSLKLNDNTHKLQLTADIFNFGNLLNKDWGATYSTNEGYSYQTIMEYQGLNSDNQTTYKFNDTAVDNERFNINDLSSRWRAQLGVRYIFN